MNETDLYGNGDIVTNMILQQNLQKTRISPTISNFPFEIQQQHFHGSHFSQKIITNMTNSLYQTLTSRLKPTLVFKPLKATSTQSLPFLTHLSC